MDYDAFLARKLELNYSFGHDCLADLSATFHYQKPCIEWACKKGRAALFQDTGLGKTLQQLMWADSVVKSTSGKVIVLAPLSVTRQTVREGEKFGISVNLCSSMEDVKDGINITNYEKLHLFDCSVFDGVVVDESGIMKNFSGKIRNQIIDNFKHTPYKLSCSATPAPNDPMELGNQSEFLGIMSRTEMLSMFFVHDGGETSKWRLKGHAPKAFWKWMSSWALMMKKPSDIGFSNDELDTVSLTAFAGTGDAFVKTWYDQSGNSNDATQTATGSQPKIVSSGAVIVENGKPAVEFDGTDDAMALGSHPFTNANLTVFAVGKQETTSEGILYNFGNGSDNAFSISFNRTANTYTAKARIGAANLNQGSTDNQTRGLYTQIVATSSNEGYKNGTQGTQNINGRTLFTANEIGSRGSTEFLNGTVQELIAYDSDKSTDQSNIEDNINTFYDIF